MYSYIKCNSTDVSRYYDALCSIPFNLICNMTTFRKEMFLHFYPNWGLGVCKDRVLGEGGSTGQIFSIMLLHVSSPLTFNWICNMTNFRKKHCFDL